MNVSLSQVNTFRTCEAKYFHQYVEHLNKQGSGSAPMELGSLLHTYLEHYYRGIQQGRGSVEAHFGAYKIVSDRYTPELQGMANVAYSLGDDESAGKFIGMMERASLMIHRYYTVRGFDDAQRYEILEVEKRIVSQIGDDLFSAGAVDLITRDRNTGLIGLWEHKSTGDVPSHGYRLRDLQTALYAAQVAYDVDHVVWNYIRTVEPTRPKPLKGGGVERRKNIDTTWYWYEQAVVEAGDDPDDYAEMRAILEPREAAVFFPRYEQVILTNDGPILGDYVQSAKDIQQRRAEWQAGTRSPIHTFTRSCDYCPYLALCQTVAVGGEIEDLKLMRYSRDLTRLPSGEHKAQTS